MTSPESVVLSVEKVRVEKKTDGQDMRMAM